MNQRKIGYFLQQLRKEKGLTQEQLAEHFYVSSRTVSRWETGTNMPDLDMIIDIAEFYGVGIYEIIDGERKSEKMENSTKLTLKKIVEYAAIDKKVRGLTYRIVMVCAVMFMITCNFLFGAGIKGVLYGIVPENICNIIVLCSAILGCVAIIANVLESLGMIDKVFSRKKRSKAHR